MKRFLYFFIITGVIVYLSLIWEAVEVLNFGYRLRKLRKEIKFLKKENALLKCEYIEITKPDVVENIAFKYLDMVYPRDRIYLSLKKW